MSDGVCEIDFYGETEKWCFLERERDMEEWETNHVCVDYNKICVSYLINDSNKLV